MKEEEVGKVRAEGFVERKGSQMMRSYGIRVPWVWKEDPSQKIG